MKKLVIGLVAALVLNIGVCAYAAEEKLIGGGSDDSLYGIAKTNDGGYIVTGSSSGLENMESPGGGDVYVAKFSKDSKLEWQSLYGGSLSDNGRAIKQTPDGGYIVAGFTVSGDIEGTTYHGSDDYYILKLDANGKIQWQKIYGGLASDVATGVETTSDGGYIVCGFSSSKGIDGVKGNGDANAYVMKLDKAGNQQWQQMYGGRGETVVFGITRTNDGAYVLAGNSNSTDIKGCKQHGWNDVYVLKINENGKILWQGLYGGTNLETGSAVAATADGGCIVVGSSYSDDIPGATNHGMDDMYAVKLDKTGKAEWQQMYGGESMDFGWTVVQTSNGGYLIAGTSANGELGGSKNNGLYDAYYVLLNKDGSVSRESLAGGESDDDASSAVTLADGRIICGGSSHSQKVNALVTNGGWDGYIVELK